MRTTLSIDDDVLALAKSLASQQRKSVGEVVSEMMRHAVALPAGAPPRARDGLRLLAVRPGGARVTPELVAQLQEELPG